jgi:hypothetical protein
LLLFGICLAFPYENQLAALLFQVAGSPRSIAGQKPTHTRPAHAKWFLTTACPSSIRFLFRSAARQRRSQIHSLAIARPVGFSKKS